MSIKMSKYVGYWTYTVLQMYTQVLFWAGNQGNLQNWVTSSMVPHFEFGSPPTLIIVSPKFQVWINAKGMDVGHMVDKLS